MTKTLLNQMKSISVIDIPNNPLLDSKIQTAVEGLGSWFLKLINNMSSESIQITIDFLSALKVECNLSDNHKKNLIIILSKLSINTSRKSQEMIFFSFQRNSINLNPPILRINGQGHTIFTEYYWSDSSNGYIIQTQNKISDNNLQLCRIYHNSKGKNNLSTNPQTCGQNKII